MIKLTIEFPSIDAALRCLENIQDAQDEQGSTVASVEAHTHKGADAPEDTTLYATPTAVAPNAAIIFGAKAPVAAPVPPPPAAAPEFDTAGVPWDARIHQKDRNKKLDGTWKLRKKLDPTVVTQVMAEIMPQHERRHETPAAPAPAAAPAPPAPVAAPPAPVAVPPAPSVAPNVPAAPAQGTMTFRDLMLRITEGLRVGKIKNTDVTAACKSVGLERLQDVLARPDLVPQVSAFLDMVTP